MTDNATTSGVQELIDRLSLDGVVEGQRQADFVIEVAFGCQNLPGTIRNTNQHALDRSLAIAAGDAHHIGATLVTPSPGQLAERSQRIGA